ncbi:MAG: FdhF/YdeP family oxidoreductase [Oligoflexales bacterium]
MQPGGFHSLRYTLKMANQLGFLPVLRAVLPRMHNEQGRFPKICKKSLQAVASDLQKPIPPDFWEAHSLDDLAKCTPLELEKSGRLCQPMVAAGDRHFKPLSWEYAINLVAEILRNTPPEKTFFHASGLSSNEAGFLLQMFCRAYGTNNVNNCSTYGHQASGIGLAESLGTHTSTIDLDDLENCDLFFLLGSNPAANQPRLMKSLQKMKSRGGKVIAINPVKEPGLTEFTSPSQLGRLLFGSKVADLFIQPQIGGDMAVLAGIGKYVLESNREDPTFLKNCTQGFSSYEKMIRSMSWDDIRKHSQVPIADIVQAGQMYSRSRNTVFGWTMGITHHTHGVDNVRSIVNLALLRGMVGRRYAGLLPIRGLGNAQGMESMRVTPKLDSDFLQKLERKGLSPPTWDGLNAMECMEGARTGKLSVGFCLGGNLFGSNPDTRFSREAMSQLDAVVYLGTTLNTGHIHGRGKQTFILPVRARDEESQVTTEESMFNNVRICQAGRPRIPEVKSEVEIISDIAHQVLGPKTGQIEWERLSSHTAIRSLIAELVPGFSQLRDIDRTKKEFTVPGRALRRTLFPTLSHRAQFFTTSLPHLEFDRKKYLKLMAVQSEGQFNTVVHEQEDFYRGQTRRDVILMHPDDIREYRLMEDDHVKVTGPSGEPLPAYVRPFDIARGNCLMYFPEANTLMDRTFDPVSKTPAFKSVLIRIEPV